MSDVITIGIAGGTGSGKTTITRRILDEFGGASGVAGGSRQGQQRQGQGSGRLSEAQLSRLYKKAEAAGMTKERTIARILEKYKKHDPATLTRQEYDEICNSLDAAAAQHNQQGGQG